MSNKLDRYERELLGALDEQGGFCTGRVVDLVGIGLGHNARTASALARQKLLSLQARGFVRPLDEHKPVAWQRTQAGTAVLEK